MISCKSHDLGEIRKPHCQRITSKWLWNKTKQSWDSRYVFLENMLSLEMLSVFMFLHLTEFFPLFVFNSWNDVFCALNTGGNSSVVCHVLNLVLVGTTDEKKREGRELQWLRNKVLDKPTSVSPWVKRSYELQHEVQGDSRAAPHWDYVPVCSRC